MLETLPSMSIDKRNPEDLDSSGNDHGVDALRYLCKARLIDAKWEQTPDVVGKGIVKLQSYIARIRARNKRPTI